MYASDPFREVIAAERFEQRLKELAAMTPEQKHRRWNALNRNERNRAADHARANELVDEARAWRAVCDADENMNHDQPI